MYALCRLLLVVALLVLPWSPVFAQAVEPETEIFLAQATGDDDDIGIEADLQSTGGNIGPPPDAEIFRVRGRAITAVEQDVPESSTTFDAADIEALGAQSIEDLAKVTPNVEIRTTGATTPTFFIRGVGLSDFNSNAPGAISIYQDNVPINAPAIQLGLLYDLENVVIERGPQGDGPYRNASGGVIQVMGRRPTGTREAYLRVDYGNFAFVDVEGAVEAPITEESLQARLAFRYVSRDGYVENGCGNIPVSLAQRQSELAPTGGTLPNGDPEFGFVYQDVAFCAQRRQRDGSFQGQESRFPFPAAGQPPVFDPNGNSVRGRLSRVPGGLPGRLNDRGVWAAKGYLRWQPPETEMDFIFNIHGSRLNQLSNAGQAIGTGGNFFGGSTRLGYVDPDIKNLIGSAVSAGVADVQDVVGNILARNLDSQPYRGDFNRVGDTILDSWGTYLEASIPIGDARLRSVTGYEWYDRFRDTDTDYTPNVIFERIEKDTAWQVTQDLQLKGELDETPLKWTTGVFYLMQKLKSESELFTFPSALNRPQEFTEDIYSLGMYAMFDWEFLDDFTLHAGARYNWEQKSFDLLLERNDFPKRQATWSAPTGTVSLRYRFSDRVNIYWKYNRGWKSGHFNASTTTGRETPNAEPETIDAFEIGTAGTWFDGRLYFDLSLFYYGYEDYQVFIVENILGSFPTLKIVNANNAEVYGLETTLRVEPIDRLIVTGRFGWLQSEFLDFTNERIIQTNGGVVGDPPIPIANQLSSVADFTGNRLINSPPFKASISIQYTIPVGRFGQIIPFYDTAWSDDIFFDASEGRGSPNFAGETTLPEFAIGQRAYWIHNLRLTYRLPTGNMEIAGWVRNLSNQVFKSYAFDASNFFDLTLHFPGQPRTYGGSISFAW